MSRGSCQLLAYGTEEDVGAAVGLVAYLAHLDHHLLVIVVGGDGGIVERRHAAARAIHPVVAVAKADDGVGHAVAVLARLAGLVVLHQPEHPGVASRGLAGALGVAVQHQGVVMVGGDHDQGVFQLGVGFLHLVQGGLDGVVEGQGVLQGALGVGVVQGVIDAAPPPSGSSPSPCP